MSQEHAGDMLLLTSCKSTGGRREYRKKEARGEKRRRCGKKQAMNDRSTDYLQKALVTLT
jgi:hypothetical protein